MNAPALMNPTRILPEPSRRNVRRLARGKPGRLLLFAGDVAHGFSDPIEMATADALDETQCHRAMREHLPRSVWLHREGEHAEWIIHLWQRQGVAELRRLCETYNINMRSAALADTNTRSRYV